MSLRFLSAVSITQLPSIAKTRNVIGYTGASLQSRRFCGGNDSKTAITNDRPPFRTREQGRNWGEEKREGKGVGEGKKARRGGGSGGGKNRLPGN